MTRKIFAILAICILMVGGFAFMQYRAQATASTNVVAPDFDLMTFEGELVRLSDLRGKVVMLNFWASWCGPCRVESPEIQAAWEHYEARGDVVFIGIAYNDQVDATKAFIDEYGLTYINGPDLGHTIVDAFGVQGIPSTFIIGKDGVVKDFLFARINMDMLINAIEPLLQ